MNAARKACCCCSANGTRIGWGKPQGWIPPVLVKLEPSAAIPSTVLERAETGARPLRAAMLGTLCAPAAAVPITRVKSPIPNPSLLMAPPRRLAGAACRPIPVRLQDSLRRKARVGLEAARPSATFIYIVYRQSILIL